MKQVNNEFVFLFRQPAVNHSPERQKEIDKKKLSHVSQNFFIKRVE